MRGGFHPGSILILIHDPIQSPVQSVLHAPVLADGLVESLRRQGRAEQRIGRLLLVLAELIRIEVTEQMTKVVVSGYVVGPLQEAAQKRVLGLGKRRHVHFILTTAKHGA